MRLGVYVVSVVEKFGTSFLKPEVVQACYTNDFSKVMCDTNDFSKVMCDTDD